MEDEEFKRLSKLFAAAPIGGIIVPDKEPHFPPPDVIRPRSDNLTRVEALEWAADYAERNKLFAVPMKSNGYPIDGFKAPTFEEKTSAIIQLAEWVAGG